MKHGVPHLHEPFRFPVVTCNGCFDRFHFGHAFFLGFCVAHSHRLVVGVNSDAYIVKYKRPDPIPINERLEAIRQFSGSPYCEIEAHEFSEDTPEPFISIIGPDAHCIGRDPSEDVPELAFLTTRDIPVIWVPRLGSISTTENLKGDLDAG